MMNVFGSMQILRQRVTTSTTTSSTSSSRRRNERMFALSLSMLMLAVLLRRVPVASSWAVPPRHRHQSGSSHRHVPVRRTAATTAATTAAAAATALGAVPKIAGNERPFLEGVAASSGIAKEELRGLTRAMVFACREHNAGFSLDETELLAQPSSLPTEIPGATGRFLLLRASNFCDDDDVLQDLECAICHEMDQLLYADPPLLSQPIVLSVVAAEEEEEEDAPLSMPAETMMARRGEDAIQRAVERHELAVPLPRKGDAAAAAGVPRVPCLHIEVDGAMVRWTNDHFTEEAADHDRDDSPTFWDTSTILVFDDLVTDDLRQRLLDVVVGHEQFEEQQPWDDVTNGPDPRRWVRGGLKDVPDDDDATTETTGDDETATNTANEQQQQQQQQPCWGLSDDAIDDLCLHHDAMEEFEMIVAGLFPQFTVCKQPHAVFGSTVSPLTANAPTRGDRFAYHIDADPLLTPPSPWTDVYGRYPNRQRGKPRFVSCLVYLNDEWKADEWGAPTRFLDVATDTHYDVSPRPGRCVFMDQDISHTVVAPTKEAGNRPRYSLVWKLILHPKEPNQDMSIRPLSPNPNWPEPILIGSAAALSSKQQDS